MNWQIYFDDSPEAWQMLLSIWQLLSLAQAEFFLSFFTIQRLISMMGGKRFLLSNPTQPRAQQTVPLCDETLWEGTKKGINVI